MKKPTISSEIKYLEDNIKLKESLGKDASFEKKLLKSLIKWRKKHGDFIEPKL